ncbi:AEC family transporter [Candidatus Vondammii sp. HM_W22]|uniref:AEC family transporter n=1 Tax=Candidatus Vondammii sp. HM_W22 TaxID=2687299 RepID=UPI001F14540C|nr:hypothetical protein [Candidatus Vondammii sp. HM_W22]
MMFSNSGNMGLPLALFAFGEQAMSAAVVLMILTNGLHFSVGMKMMDSKASIIGLLRVPILAATVAGLVVSMTSISISEVVAIPIEMMGQIATPLLLFSLGVRLTSVDLKDWHWSDWCAGMSADGCEL